MKALNYLFFVLISVYSSLHAQDHSDVLLDSMLRETERAFDLFQQSRYGEAIEINTKVLKYAINTNNSILEGRNYAALGNSHYYVNKDSLSFYYLFKAKDVFLKEKDTFNLVIAYNDIGVNFKDFDSIDKASEYFNKAMSIALEGKHLQDVLYPLSNIADIEIYHKEEYVKGIENSFKVLDYAKQVGGYDNRRFIGETYLQISYAYHKLKNETKSKLYFKKCSEFSKKNKYIEVLSDLYEQHAKLYKEENNYKMAYALLKEHTILKDSVTKIKEYEKAKQIEADNFLRENNKKLVVVKREKEFQEANAKKANLYNLLLAIFSFGLLLSSYFIFKKNKQLNIAKQKAEKLSKVKSDFYSEISHELRTPLYGVIELSNILLKENVNTKHREYLESLNFSGNHLLSLINNVLELNKLEYGELKLQALNFKLKNLINNIIESLEFALRDSGNTIHLDYDDAIPLTLTGDSLKLSQVFINLISNAIKFTNNGNIYITIKLIENSENDVKLFFEVKDDGIGISKEKQLTIFEEFYQEHANTEKSYKGTGLGLSIVKRILTTMQSDIHIESELGKGTAFNFEISVSKIDQNILRETEHEGLLKDIKGKKILIVDDNKINQLVTKKILDQFHVQSNVVSSGAKSIELIKNEHFDCVLMDLHMPELDGYATTSLIRKFNKIVPIIALTAASTEEVEAKINTYEMNGYIMKPFVTSDFIETIHYHMFAKHLDLPKDQTA